MNPEVPLGKLRILSRISVLWIRIVSGSKEGKYDPEKIENS